MTPQEIKRRREQQARATATKPRTLADAMTDPSVHAGLMTAMQAASAAGDADMTAKIAGILKSIDPATPTPANSSVVPPLPDDAPPVTLDDDTDTMSYDDPTLVNPEMPTTTDPTLSAPPAGLEDAILSLVPNSMLMDWTSDLDGDGNPDASVCTADGSMLCVPFNIATDGSIALGDPVNMDAMSDTVDGQDASLGMMTADSVHVPAATDIEPQTSSDEVSNPLGNNVNPQDSSDLIAIPQDAATNDSLVTSAWDAETDLTAPARTSLNQNLVSKLAVTLAQGVTRAWVNIANIGSFAHPEYGSLDFTPALVNTWRRNLLSGAVGGLGSDGKPRVAIDYEHAMDDDTVAPHNRVTAAHLADIAVKNGRIYGLLEFTAQAAQQVREGKWSWFSVSTVSNLFDKLSGCDLGPGLIGGALTNRPFIPGLKAINLSDLRPAQKGNIMQSTTLLAETRRLSAQIKQLQNRNAQIELEADLKQLSDAGVPPVILNQARAILSSAAASVVKLSDGRGVSLRSQLVKTLSDMAATGSVPAGKRYRQQLDVDSAKTEAIKKLQDSNPKLSYGQAMKAAARANPQLFKHDISQAQQA